MSNQFFSWEEAVAWLIAQPDKQELVRACYFDQPLGTAAERYWLSDEWKALRKYLPEEIGHALDVGAGQGVSSFAFAKDGWRVTALEPDPSCTVGVGAINKLAIDNSLKIDTVQEFGERLPFSDESFDVVFARQVLHHARDLPKLCSEMGRVLKKGGTFISARDHVISRREDLPRFFAIHPLHKLYGGENAFLFKEYIDAIQAAGLRISQTLRPFDSPINFGPKSHREFQQDFEHRFRVLPLGAMLARVALSKPLFGTFLKIAGFFDNRPGRLYSFVASKPLV
jgi:SAM-dependent methyltransferase